MRKLVPLLLLLSIPAAAEEAKRQVKFSGFVQTQGETGDRVDTRFSDDNDRIFLRRARLGLAASVVENVEVRLEIDLAGSLSSSNGLRAQMTDGYLHWKRNKALQVRAGQFKTPYGWEHLTSDTKLATPERALVTDRLSQGRQMGVQVSGDHRNLSYAIGTFNGTPANSSGNDDDGFLTAGRLSAALTKAWSAGVSAYTSEDRAVTLSSDFRVPGNTFSGRRRGLAVDSHWNRGRLSADAEILRTSFDSKFDSTGWVAQAGWFVVPERLQLLVRHERFDPNTGRVNDDTRTWSGGANYLLKGHDLKLQAQYLRSESAGERAGRLILRAQATF